MYKRQELDSALREIDEKLTATILPLPNIPNDNIPDGKDSDENREVRRVGTPRAFDFEPKAHWDIGENLGILDPTTAAKVTGARFHFYKGYAARLERAIMNFFLDSHMAHGYTEVFPPFMVNRASMTGTGQLPKFEEDAFKVEGTDYFLIPTAEVPVTNMHRGDILDGLDGAIKYCAYSACFRAEAGLSLIHIYILPEIAEQVQISLKYEGYIKRQYAQIEQFQRLEERTLPSDIDYAHIAGLRIEARQKLSKVRPRSIGQASRISGVSPADMTALMMYLNY